MCLEKPPHSCHTDQCRTWLNVYGIEERYKAKCCGENDGKYLIAQVLDEWWNNGKTLQDYLATLKRQIKTKPLAEINFLKYMGKLFRNGFIIKGLTKPGPCVSKLYIQLS